ncbi:hypothetical protein ABZZ22_26480, partial [Nocardioides sp. NPDC006273]
LSGKERPKVCFVATASGDADSYHDKFLAGRPFSGYGCLTGQGNGARSGRSTSRTRRISPVSLSTRRSTSRALTG